MALGSNPTLNENTFSPERRHFGSRQGPAMTYDDVIIRTLGCLAVLLAGAAVPVFVLPGAAMSLMIIGLVAGFTLGMINSFKREPVPALIIAYAAAEGLLLGGITQVMDAAYPGIALQAVVGTLAVFTATLVLFKSGKVRATPKAMRFFLIALVGYVVFSLVNLGLMLFGVLDDPWGVRGIEVAGIPLGIIIGLLAVCMAAFSLIVDFTIIENGVRSGIPRRYSWSAAFGLTVTLVWLYMEILRLLAILRGK